jgi:putative ABC transport system permease protein
MWQDLRYAIRTLIKNTGFTLAAIGTLALGIGANAAIFSLVYGVLLRPLPYRDGARLVVLHQEAARADLHDIPFSAKEIFDYRDLSHTLDAVVEHHTMNFLLLGPDSAERVNTAVVSANFFDVLGVKPMLGRTFVAADENHGADAVLILSYEYWKGRYGGDPNIVGRVFQMNNRPHTVIGVLPPIPQYPVSNDVYMPTSQCPFRSSPAFIANRTSRMMTAFGRVKPGVTLAAARADLSTLASQIAQANPDAYPAKAGYGIAVAPLQEDLTRRARTTFLILLSAAGLVLLIACANVANLMLARLLKIERELAVRIALGATRWRLVREHLTESLLLSLTGGALGLALAPAALAMLAKFAERFTTRSTEVKLDAPALWFTLAVSLLTGIAFGLAPALSAGRNLTARMQQGGRNTAGAQRQRARGVLVVAQVAVSFMLLIGAGLMIRSFVRLQSVEPGFRTDRLLTVRISPNFTRHTGATIHQMHDEIVRRVKSVAGVESVALASNLPFDPDGIAQGPGSVDFQIEGRATSKGEVAPQVDITFVSAGYFDTLRQPVIAGRAFSEHDDPNTPFVAVINQTMAKHRWPNEDPVGRRVSFDKGKTWVKIEGVAGDVKEYGLARKVADEIYLSVDQDMQGNGNRVVVRTAADPMSVAAAVREVLHQIDPQLAVDRVNTVERLRTDSIASPRVTAILLGLFAALAMIISGCGIAASLALSVRQRTNELGVRMALGASRESIVWMVVRQGLTLAAAGAVIGTAGALALTRLLEAVLYSTSPTDAATFIAVSALFLAIALIACFIPARQVTAIDPVIALRQE